MTLSEIITELENLDLETDEIKTSAGNLQAALLYFFEQIESRPTWTREELHELRIGSQVAKAEVMLEETLRSRKRTPTA